MGKFGDDNVWQKRMNKDFDKKKLGESMDRPKVIMIITTMLFRWF